MKAIIIALISLTFVNAVNSQTLPEIDWAYGLGSAQNDQSTSITTDLQGNVYVIGHFVDSIDINPGVGIEMLSSNGSQDVFVLKLDSAGNYVWGFSLGGSSPDKGQTIAVDLYGNVFIGGDYGDTVDFDPNIGSEYILNSNGIEDGFLAKYSSSGSFIWAIHIDNGYDGGLIGIKVNNLAEIFVTGYFVQTVDFDPSASIANVTSNGEEDVYLAKYDGNGNYIWAFGIGGEGMDYVTDIDLDEGKIVLTGKCQDTVQFDPDGISTPLKPGIQPNVFVAKYTEFGDYEMAFIIDHAFSCTGYSIEISNGDIYLSGSFWGSLDFDTSGTTLTSNGNQDLFIAKYDSIGNYQWAISAGGDDLDAALATCVDNDGYVYSLGFFEGVVDFNPDTAIDELNGGTNPDIYLAKFDSDGNYLWAFKIGDSLKTDYGYSISLTEESEILITGEYRGQMDVDPSNNFNYLSSNGLINSDVFILKYTQPDASIDEAKGLNSIATIYPNPTTHQQTISIQTAIGEKLSIDLYDLHGRKLRNVYRGNATSEKMIIQSDVADLSPALYLYRIEVESLNSVVRFVKQ